YLRGAAMVLVVLLRQDGNPGIRDSTNLSTAHITIGARSGKVLRATLTYPPGHGTTQKTAKGTNDVRALLANLPPSPCPPDHTTPGADA
ncbi:hypothetical protein, partial [Streptomyces sp. NPDC000410]|uniref:hypothetical protein n=1 Tax=Streptomyces sp. NPDC000410 TaxID=3154254 RepID=UPI00332F084B